MADAFDRARTFALEVQSSERDIAGFFAATQFDGGRRLIDFFDAPSLSAIRAAPGAGETLDRDLAQRALLNAAPGRLHQEIAPHFAELTRHPVENRTAQMAHRLFLPLRALRAFVTVGAVRLHGERGLLALLRDQGYRVSVVC